MTPDEGADDEADAAGGVHLSEYGGVLLVWHRVGQVTPQHRLRVLEDTCNSEQHSGAPSQDVTPAVSQDVLRDDTSSEAPFMTGVG